MPSSAGHTVGLGFARPTWVSAVPAGYNRRVYSFFARDPWLDGPRGQLEFKAILRRAEERYRHAVAAYRQADGPRLLGVGA